jgi:phage terminase large subunit-like protein
MDALVWALTELMVDTPYEPARDLAFEPQLPF